MDLKKLKKRIQSELYLLFNYKKEIASLDERIARLEETAEEADYYHQESISRAQHKARQAENARYEAERKAESDRNSRDWDRDRAVKDLERAREWGNEYEEANAIKKLKRL